MEEDKDEHSSFRTCQLCPFRSKSGFIMYQHEMLHDLHEKQSKTDTLVCTKALEMFTCEFCYFKTAVQVDLTEHYRVVHEEKKANKQLENILKCHRCEDCDFETHSLVVLLKHMDGSHSNKEVVSVREVNEDSRTIGNHRENIKRFECGKCGYQAKTKSYLKQHIFIKHTDPENINWFTCEQCVFKTKTKYGLRRHFKLRHTNSENIKWFKSGQSVLKVKIRDDLHQDQNSEIVNLFECEQCTYKTRRESDLRKHIKMRHYKNEASTCDIDKWIEVTTPEGVNWFKCKQCIRMTKEINDMKNHVLEHVNAGHTESEESTIENFKWYEFTSPEGIKCFKCKHCVYRTSEIDYMESHMLEHGHVGRKIETKRTITEDPPIEDPPIEETKWYELTTPEGVKWLKCTQCVLMTKEIDDMKNHFSLEHPNAFKAKRKRKLKQHVVVNQPDKSTEPINSQQQLLVEYSNPEILNWFKCKQCAYKTVVNTDLYWHIILKHTENEFIPIQNDDWYVVTTPEGAKWLKCKHCVLITKEVDDIKNHVLMEHIEATEWIKCLLCAHKTKDKPGLRQHILQRHVNPQSVNLFECTLCPYKALKSDSLELHLERMHTKT